MAKRKPKKTVKRKVKNKSPISSVQMKTLQSDLKSARARIRAMQRKGGYTGPSESEYAIDKVMQRLRHGERLEDITNEVKGISEKRIRREEERKLNTPVTFLENGVGITQRQMTQLTQTITSANQLIQKMRNANPDNLELIPEAFTLQDVLDKASSSKSLDKYMKLIEQSYVPEKMQLTSLNDDGEAITQAEKEYLRGIIDIENKKRERNAEYVAEIFKTRGFFMSQQEFAVTPVKDETWNLQQYRKRSKYYTEATYNRHAEQWRENYINSIEGLEGRLRRDNGFPQDSQVFKDIEYIIEQVRNLSDADMITAATLFSDRFMIYENNYVDGIIAEGNMAAVRKEWDLFYDQYDAG